MTERCKTCPEYKLHKSKCSRKCKKEPRKVLYNGKEFTMCDIQSIIQQKTGIHISLTTIHNYSKELEKYLNK